MFGNYYTCYNVSAICFLFAFPQNKGLMDEQIEQMMRTLKLGGLAKEWRSVEYTDNGQYVTDLLMVELREREANRINRMADTVSSGRPA